MKLHQKIGILAITILVLLFPLNGCAIRDNYQTPQEEDTEKSALAGRVAELEATLQAEREENYITKAALEEKIKLLEEKLSLLTSGNDNTPDGNTMVFHYKVKNGFATITQYEGNATLVEIPSTLDGYTVTHIGERAFEGNTYIAAVIVPPTVVTVDWFAFYGCSSLFDVTLPASVTTIGHAVFDGCAGPTVTCPKGSYAADYAKSYGIACIEK